LIEHIRHGEEIFATILRAGFHSDGIEFLSGPCGLYESGQYSTAHNPVARRWEVLIIKSGKVRFYDDIKIIWKAPGQGDIVLLLLADMVLC
jgi:hypothetical protein